ncbi:MAG TPA: AAA family ATPase [Dehalococcoidia bacterium]|nr:AAA family ATPase [Dehalococcoidia bacterium]
MADRALLELVVARLSESPPQQDAAAVVVAAFEGEDAVRARLRGDGTGIAVVLAPVEAATSPPAVHLIEIEVEGFRGIGPPAVLRVEPGPGLTLVMGRNGSGKSSFAEALEVVLTGRNRRWERRSQVWRDGWQNLHHRHTRLTMRFAVEGRRAPLEVSRTWQDGAAVDQSQLTVDAKPAASLDALGWTQPLADYPPLLSHNELEHALDEPVKLHDALSGILGLGDLTDAIDALRKTRLALGKAGREAGDAGKQLIARLERADDERAQVVIAQLRKRTPDLAVVQRAVTGGGSGGDDGGTLRRLRDLAGLPVLDRELVVRAAADLREAANAVAYQRETDAGRAHATASLLREALAFHAHTETSDCPVCGTPDVLSFAWRLKTQERIAELEESARAAETAQAGLRAAVHQARRLIISPPRTLQDAAGLTVDVTGAVTAWETWAAAPQDDDAAALARHLETQGPPLINAVASLRAAANAELERRELSWQPLAEAVLEWLQLGRAAADAATHEKRVKAAEEWLRGAHDAIRNERFQPIAGAVQENWATLRQESNVTLGALELSGSGNQRRLKLDVTIDGEEGSALGVMSQGELNCLALSLFLPRASMPESPFHFVVIDDPVQAMDPAKVEGLARVLERAARDRQVIVLTHDDRLADAVRHLDIAATTIEIARREQSAVAARRVHDPASRYIDDAMAVAQSDDVPEEAVRVIPGFCRLALESASQLAAARRMRRQGARYAEVHAAMEGDKTLLQWLALGVFGDAQRSGDVVAALERRMPGAAEVVRRCNRGAHGGTVLSDRTGFVRSTERLVAVIGDEHR